MAEQSQTKHKRSWVTVVVIVAVVVVAGGAGVLLRWWQANKTPAMTSIDVARDVQKKINTEGLSGEKAEAAIDEALQKKNLSAQDTYYLYMQKGSMAQQGKDYKAALEAYKKAAASQETDNVYEFMGIVSGAMGDKEQAIKYFERAIELIPQDSPVRNSSRERLQKNIDSLKGLPVEGPPPQFAQ